MEQRPTKATFVSRDVQSSSQITKEQIENQTGPERPTPSFWEEERPVIRRTPSRSTFSSARPRKSTYSRVGRTETKKKSTTYGQRAGRRLAICCAIALGCVGLRYVKLPFAQQTTDFLKNAFTYDLNIEESIGRLQFVEKLWPDVTAVFGDQQQFSYPVTGAIIQKFGEDGKEYIQFQAQPNADVVCALDGQVEKRGINDKLGKYLKIRHTNNLATVYYGMDQSQLAEGTDVKQGQTLGTLSGDGLFCFQVLSGDTPKDPQKYLGVK